MILRKIAVLKNGKRKKQIVLAINSGRTQSITDKAKSQLNSSREKMFSMSRSLFQVKKCG